MVIAVVIDSQGNRVLFAVCSKSNGLDTYQKLAVWDARKVNRKNWKPDRDWGSYRYGDKPPRAGYPNSISLIKHNNQIYFVGMHNTDDRGIGKDWVDLYRVNLDKDADDNKRLIKVGHEHVECDGADIEIDFLPSNLDEKFAKSFFGPSFRWGGNARMRKIRNGNAQDKILEVLAVERNFFNNQAKYNKFCFKIDEKNKNDKLTQCEIQLGAIGT